MSRNSLVERLAVGKAAEMEGSSPTILVEVGCEVVVVSSETCIFCFSRLQDLLESN
jgi:hypothetical protein